MTTLLDQATARAADPRVAQARWAKTPLADRLRIVRELRHLLAEHAEALAFAAGETSSRPLAEKLVSEVLPLADACRWLERESARILAPRRHGKRGRPWWLTGHSFEVQRQPHGLVLVIGPGNYPLLLPAVQALQALVAGNAVLLKPAPETRGVALAFADLAMRAGLERALLTVLPESVKAAHQAIEAGVDKVIFTGSCGNGRDVLALLAQTNTPSVMELSGEDAVIVLADADLDLVVRALRFGKRLNNGETCIAPRRLIAVTTVAAPLAERLGKCVISLAADDEAALRLANAGEFALGASVFSRDIARARALASRLKTGFVTINDLIVPTADPRMPFGGTKASGFGATRGEEGLLEMTFPHVVAVRRGRLRPHFDEPAPGDARLFTAWIRAAHGRRRFPAIPEFFRALIASARHRKS